MHICSYETQNVIYENGQREIIAHYNEKREKHGIYKEFLEDGTIYKHLVYKNGISNLK